MCVSGGGSPAGGKSTDVGPGGNNGLNIDALPPELQPYKDAIISAAKQTGLDPNLLAAVIWAESRGNPNEASTNPEDGQADVGLMQISQSTYDNEVRAKHPGLPKLDVNDPVQNILAGAYELKFKMLENGGKNPGLQAYVGDDPNYVPRVNAFYMDMLKGIQMPDEDPPVIAAAA